MEQNINQYNESGNKEGLWLYTDVNNKVWCEANYKDGIPHGRYKDIMTHIEVTNNKGEIIQLDISDCGGEEGYFDNGEKIGLWKWIRPHKIKEEIFIR